MSEYVEAIIRVREGTLRSLTRNRRDDKLRAESLSTFRLLHFTQSNRKMFAAVRTPTARLAAAALRPSAFRVAVPQARHYHEKVRLTDLISNLEISP